MIKGIKKAITVSMLCALTLSTIGCAKKDEVKESTTKEVVKVDEEKKQEQPKEVVIRFATNSPDQSAGMGMLEKRIADAYMAENPHIKIEFELNDNEVHKQKLKVYASANNMPDLYMNWADPSALVPMVKGGYAEALSKDDFEEYGFLPGALDDVSYKGELYGLPRNFDIWFLMYNEKMFKDHNLEIPKTMAELKQVSDAFLAKGIAPSVMNGKDKWNEVVLLNDLMVRASGEPQIVKRVFDNKGKFSDEPYAVEAANILKDYADGGFFQDGYLVTDYNTAQNLFVQGKSPMYYIGSWELSMASRDDFPKEFTENVRATFFPTMDEREDSYKHVIGRTGGIYSVNAKSEVKEEATAFLKYMFKPENWTKLAWEEGVCTPAQSWDQYMTGNETQLQKDVSNIFSEAKSTSGFMYAWRLTPSFEQDCLNNISELLVGNITAEEYWQAIDESIKQNPID